MLWSDEQSPEPSAETRRVQAMLRRAMLVIALAASVVMTLVTWRP